MNSNSPLVSSSVNFAASVPLNAHDTASVLLNVSITGFDSSATVYGVVLVLLIETIVSSTSLTFTTTLLLAVFPAESVAVSVTS